MAASATALLASSTPAEASAVVAADAASAADLREVIGNLTRLVVGFLVSLGTLFLTVGFARYMSANGDPSEVERAKASLRNAALGYGGAVLAPVFMRLLQSVVDVS
jgi:hypothetical protein